MAVPNSSTWGRLCGQRAGASFSTGPVLASDPNVCAGVSAVLPPNFLEQPARGARSLTARWLMN